MLQSCGIPGVYCIPSAHSPLSKNHDDNCKVKQFNTMTSQFGLVLFLFDKDLLSEESSGSI